MSDIAEIPTAVKHWYNFRLVIFLESIAIGVLTGIVVVAFRYCLNQAYYLRKAVYSYLAAGEWWKVLIWVLIIIVSGLIIGMLIHRYPIIRGSGIPQIKGALLRQVKLNWFPEMLLKFFGGILGVGLGLSLGREGPSVQLGAYVGKGFFSLAKRPPLERKYLLTSGAAAGLTAAFNAPLAGVIFVLEELHKNFSSLLLLCSMAASVAANMVAGKFFGLKPVFQFHAIAVLPLKYYHFLLLFGIFCGLSGDVFKKGLYAFQDFYTRLKIPVVLRPVMALAASIPIGFFLIEATGGGHHLIESLFIAPRTLSFLLIVLAVKFLFTLFSYGSGAPGGIFLPLLVLGALIGKICGTLLFQWGWIEEQFVMNFLILGMAAFFTSVVRAPVTGAVLILEMSGTFNHFMGLIFICVVAYVITDIIKSRAVYDVLLDKLLLRNPQLLQGKRDKRVILEVPVMAGSVLENRELREVDWPDEVLIIGIARGEKELIPDGKTEIHGGDILHILSSEEDAVNNKRILLSLGLEKDFS